MLENEKEIKRNINVSIMKLAYKEIITKANKTEWQREWPIEEEEIIQTMSFRKIVRKLLYISWHIGVLFPVSITRYVILRQLSYDGCLEERSQEI